MINSFVHTITADSQPIVLWCIEISKRAFTIQPLNIPWMRSYVMVKNDNESWQFVGDVPYPLKKKEKILGMYVSLSQSRDTSNIKIPRFLQPNESQSLITIDNY